MNKGKVLEVEGQEITVITPESPIGAALMNRQQDDTYSFREGLDGRVLYVG